MSERIDVPVQDLMEDIRLNVVDIQDFNLPLLDEPIPPSLGQYTQPHTQAWAAAIAGFDGYVFVTPEYNHGTSGALKNAIDFLFKEWNNKAAGFVGYGSAGGARAIENLCYVIAPAQSGFHPNGRETYGDSMIVDYWGRVLRRLPRDVQGRP